MPDTEWGLQVLVIGAGVVGLSTAVCLQQDIPDVSVSVLAESFGRQTTADGAAGIFTPNLNRLPGKELNLLRQWCQDSFSHYDKLARSEDAYHCGCSVISGYDLYNRRPKQELFLKDFVYDYRELSQIELDRFGGNHGFGIFITILIVECRRYLPWLMNQFRLNGGHVHVGKALDLKQFVGDYDVIVNCAGLGSRELVNDPGVTAMRGQTIRVKAPWIKMFYRDLDTFASIIPGADTVYLGGTRQVGDEDRNTREEDTHSIFNRCAKLLPSLKRAEVQWHWVGLRPCREPSLRLEVDTIRLGSQDIPLVHNYGHGGLGITLAWGTAKHACKMIKSAVKRSQDSSAKL